MRDSVLRGTRFLVRVLMMLNIVVGIAFAALILISVSINNPVLSQLARKYGASAGDILFVMGLMLVTGLVAVALAHVFLKSLRDILTSVAAGDPFIAENGRRLRRMGFAMLAFQIGDLILGLIDHWLDRLGADTMAWYPSLGGWLTVLLLFILARVFAVGAAMRDDLEGTV